ncbi:MAG: SET domain-containing protein [Mangrovibacterium sp.]
MIHPHTALKYINDEIGYGVFTTKPIPAGTIIWAKDQLDRELTPAEFHQLPLVCKANVENHTFRNRNGNFILCWDICRYMNHSFHSNCLATAYDFEIALRDIEAGEELTDDYGYLNIIAPFEACDEGTERKVVYPDDLLRFHPLWDEQFLALLPAVLAQQQVLAELIPRETWEHLHEVARGNVPLQSILKNYFNLHRV